jgi:hypothetical protein
MSPEAAEAEVGVEDEDEDEDGARSAWPRETEFCGSCLEKQTKNNTPAHAKSAIKTMATAIGRLFIVT